MTNRNGSGSVPGLAETLRECLRAFKPSVEGVFQVMPQMMVSFPMEMWSSYAWPDVVTSTLAIGETDLEPVLTVPNDERVWLESMAVVRSSGDNVIIRLNAVQPDGYGTGDRGLDFLRLASGASSLFWPDPGGVQTITTINAYTPLLLEPGAIVSLTPTGAGASETIFVTRLQMRRSKLHRALVPQS